MKTKQIGEAITPSMYILNVNSLAKPHAIQNLRAEVASIGPDVVIITKSKLNGKHTDDGFDISGYVLFLEGKKTADQNW